jgi:hypothetical protein
VALGWTFKGYGYHLWNNLPTLFRRLGSLEGISQQSVEGTIGKLARLLPHIQTKPCGRYSKELEHDREGKLEELMRRRANLKSPAQAIAEEFMMETLETTYEMAPSRDHSTRLPLRAILWNIDNAIASGNVVTYDKYVLYWRRYMVFERLRAWAAARVQCSRAKTAGSSAFADLKAAVDDCYSAAALKYPVRADITQSEWNVITMRMRKGRWKGVRGWGGMPVPGAPRGVTAYEAIPRFE